MQGSFLSFIDFCRICQNYIVIYLMKDGRMVGENIVFKLKGVQ